jgi:hypothetical protein
MKRARYWIRNRIVISIAAALLLACGSAAGQAIPRTAAPNPNIRLAGPQAHSPQTGHALLGKIEGFVYWDTQAVAHNPAGDCSGFSISVIAGGQTLANSGNQFGAKPAGQVKTYMAGGKIGVYDVCTYAYDNVAENVPLRVALSITQSGAFSPVAAGNPILSVGAANPIVGPLTIVNGQCNMLPNITNPSWSDLNAHPGSCQDMAYDVNFLLQPTTRAAGTAGRGPLLQNSSSAQTPLLHPGTSTVLGASNGNAGILNQPYPPKGVSNTSGSGKSAITAVRPQASGTKLVLPPNLQVFSVGEARNPAVLSMVSGPASGGGGLGPEHTMSATNSSPLPQSTTALQQRPAGPGIMQPKSGSSHIGALDPNTTGVCMPGAMGISAVNGEKFTQFTPGVHYLITGCGFGATSGKVYLSGPFPAHNGKIELGPYWNFGTQRSWNGHWSDKLIDAQLDARLSGELDEYNVILVVETSTGQQMQMNNVSFKAQRAEAMLTSSPLGSSWGVSGYGTGVSPCGAWVTSNCTLEVLRNNHGAPPTPDTYTIKLKSGFVLSGAELLVMSQTNVTKMSALQLNGNQITVNWNWTTDQSTGFTYSLYGLRIYVLGPLGVSNAWVGP